MITINHIIIYVHYAYPVVAEIVPDFNFCIKDHFSSVVALLSITFSTQENTLLSDVVYCFISFHYTYPTRDLRRRLGLLKSRESLSSLSLKHRKKSQPSGDLNPRQHAYGTA